MRILRSLVLLTTAAMPVGAMAQEAAQSEGYAAEEIIVTAQRREQSLQEVPLSVASVSATQLEDRNIRGLADFATGSIPGIQIAPFAGSMTTLAIASRGIVAGDPSQGTVELPVPLYIDGVPLGRAQGLGLELIDPERVEFLRGPQGQLFGRNAQGGAVQFVSRRPSGEFGFDVRGQIGNYGLDSQRIRVDLPEFANIRLQASFARTQQDGLTRNPGPQIYAAQRDWNYLDSIGFRIAAEWNPSDSVRVNYAYDDSDIDDGQGYLTYVPVDIRGRPAISPQAPFNGKFPDVAFSPTFHEGFNTQSRGHSLILQYEASSNITLKSISSYRETSRNGSGNLGAGLPVGGSSTGFLTTAAREDLNQNQTYQELQFLGSWDNLDVTFGASYFGEEVEDQRRSLIAGPGLNLPGLGIQPASLAGCRGLLTCLTARSEQNAKTDSYGVYGQVTYIPSILDEKLELTAGVRYTDDKKVGVRTYIAPLALPPFTAATPSGPLPPTAIFAEKRWDPAFVVKYNFTDAVNAYFRYATGYRGGGVSVRSLTFRPFGAEETKSYELGFKGRFFDNRLTLNVAAYQNDTTNQQTAFFEAPLTNPSLTNTLNIPLPYRVRGVELESVLRVSRELTLSASYAYTDAREFFEFDNPLTVAVDLTRFYSNQVPKHSGGVAVDYSRDLGNAELRFHLDYSFASAHHITGSGQVVASLGPNYVRPTTKVSMLNGRFALGEIGVGPAKAEIALFGRNLLDKTFFTFGFDGAASGGGFGQFIQAPRMYGLELRFKM
jgi:iron complex outermembrane receptor protein